MKAIFLIIFIIFKTQANEVNKIEFDGCPENSFCSKEAGLYRLYWINLLKSFESNKINESTLNNLVKSKVGIPLTTWSKMDKTSLDKKNDLISWDSPCKQHSSATAKYFISEFYTKNINPKNIINNPEIIFSNTVIKNKDNIMTRYLPRGDAPIAIINEELYYPKEEEGHFYGLFISKEGSLRIGKTQKIKLFPKEVDCPKEMIEEFYRHTPNLNFFKGHFCKEIWNQKTSESIILLSGWSCN
jgi:hypothetical protein